MLMNPAPATETLEKMSFMAEDEMLVMSFCATSCGLAGPVPLALRAL